MTPADQLEVRIDLADTDRADPNGDEMIPDQEVASLDDAVVPDDEPR